MATTRKTESRPLTGIADEIAAADAAGRTPTPADIISESGVPKIYAAMSMIMSKLNEAGISKDNTSKGVSFNYRSVDQVYAVLNPLLVDNNVILVPRYNFIDTKERVTKSGTALYFTYVRAEFDFVSTIDGSRVTIATVGEAMDTSDKSANKAMAVAFKYAAFIAFCIPVEGEDNDPDAHGQEEIRPAQSQSGNRRQRPADPPPITQEEANTNYREAITLAEACITEAGLKDVWETKIKWDRIPSGWHKKLKGELQGILRGIKRDQTQRGPAHTTTVAPAFETSDNPDDDIPF